MSRLFAGTQFDRPANCPTCGKPPAACRCLKLPEKSKPAKNPGAPQNKNRLDSGLVLTPKNSKPPADQIAKIRTEKRKGNRIVTVITGLDHPANDLPALCTALKQALGIGGSVQDHGTGRTIELQGDHPQPVATHLETHGIKSRVL